MAATTTKANCYFCGKLLTKTGAKRHLLTHAYEGEKSQQCCMLKIESPYNKNYWLYVDMPLNSTLRSLDEFLRKIWLECCGHMSMFYVYRYDEIGKNRRIGNIPLGAVLGYEYDFGSTTTLSITFVEYTTRKQQKNAVRLLARNEAPEYKCGVCGKPAEYFCEENLYEDEDPFLCSECADKIDEEGGRYLLPVVNSPRMGVCGYDGELDTFGFDPSKLYDNN